MNEHNFHGDLTRPGSAIPVPSGGFALAPGHFSYATNLDGDREAEQSWVSAEILFRYWRVLMRRWRLIAAITGVALLAGLVITLMMPSIYRATVTLQLSREQAKIVNMDGVQPSQGPGTDNEFLETQYELLQSRSLAERVVRTLNLDAENGPFGASGRIGFFAWLKQVVTGGAEPEPVSTAELAKRRRGAVDHVLGMIDIEPQRKSQLVAVNVSGPDPELASKIANALAESFIATNLERRYDASSYARGFLEDRLRELKLKLEETEKELVAYAQSESIVNTDDGRSLTTNDLITLNQALTLAKAERIQNEELWKQAEATPGLGLPQILESLTIRTLRTQLAGLSAEYQQKLGLFKPAFPQMLQLKAQITELEQQLNAEAALIKTSIKARFEASAQQEALLSQKVEGLKVDVLSLRDRSIRYNILQREVETNKTLYEGLLQRYKEIGIAGGIGASGISIIDRAEVPQSRYSPRISLGLALAGMVGLLGGIAAAFGLEFFDDTLKSPDQAEEKVGIPVVGVIPMIDEDVLTALEDPRSNVAEAYRSLRTALQFSGQTGAPKSLLVTSSQTGEGKSTTAVALAKNFAQLGYRVLLIDADLRRPTLHRIFNVANTAGLSNYLAGTAAMSGILHAPAQNLTFMPCGPTPHDPTELLAGSKMKNLVAYATRHFDMLVMDGPPILELADAPLLASMTEGTLMIVSANHVRHAVVRTRLKRLQQARVKLAGLVLTKFDMRQADSYYYYSDHYASAYEYRRGIETEPADAPPNKDGRFIS